MRKRKRSQAERRQISAPRALSAYCQSTPDLAAFLQQGDTVQQVPWWCTLEKLTCCAPIAQSLISHFSIIFTNIALIRNYMGNNLNGLTNFGCALVHFPCMIKKQQRTHSVIFILITPHPVIVSHLILLSTYWSHVGVALLQQQDYLMCCCAEPDQGGFLKRSSVLHLQIALHNHFLLPTHSSQTVLCAKAEKSANRGVQSTQGLSTGPYSSSPHCSSLNLPYQPQDSFI